IVPGPPATLESCPGHPPAGWGVGVRRDHGGRAFEREGLQGRAARPHLRKRARSCMPCRLRSTVETAFGYDGPHWRGTRPEEGRALHPQKTPSSAGLLLANEAAIVGIKEEKAKAHDHDHGDGL